MNAAALSLPFNLNTLVEICRRHAVKRVALFGSMARGDARHDSDIDLLVEFAGRTGLLASAALERELAEGLGREVDLLTEQAISPYLRDRVQREMQVLYEAG